MTDEDVIDPDQPFVFDHCVPASFLIQSMGDLSGAVGFNDFQSAEYEAATTSPEWEQDWKRLYELIGRIVFTAAAVEEALTPIVTYLLNPDKLGHARWAVQTLDQSAKLSILAKLLPDDWSDRESLIKHLTQMGVERNRIAHGTWAHFKIGTGGEFKLGWWHTYRNSNKTKLIEVETSFELLVNRAREFEALGAALDLLLHMLGDGLGRNEPDGPYEHVPLEPSIVAAAKDRSSWGSDDRPYNEDWFMPTLERLFPA